MSREEKCPRGETNKDTLDWIEAWTIRPTLKQIADLANSVFSDNPSVEAKKLYKRLVEGARAQVEDWDNQRTEKVGVNSFSRVHERVYVIEGTAHAELTIETPGAANDLKEISVLEIYGPNFYLSLPDSDFTAVGFPYMLSEEARNRIGIGYNLGFSFDDVDTGKAVNILLDYLG